MFFLFFRKFISLHSLVNVTYLLITYGKLYLFLVNVTFRCSFMVRDQLGRKGCFNGKRTICEKGGGKWFNAFK